MIRTILLFFYDWRTPIEKETDAIRKMVKVEEKKLRIKSTQQPPYRNTLKVIR